MVMEQVQIGRRSVPLDSFKQAVANNIKVKDICECLGFNSTVATTKSIIKDRIDELGLDTSHFKWNYTVSDAVLNRNREKQFNLSEDNQKYYDAFEEHIAVGSWSTYKASVGNFLEQLGDKDFAMVSVDEILRFVGERKSAVNHIRSMLYYIVNENVNGAYDKVDKRVVLWLASKMDKN